MIRLTYSPTTQKGVALPVALIMLLIATMIGLASIKTATNQEKITANMYDRSLAYQAAEAALVAAEAAILADPDIGEDCLDDTKPACPGIPSTTFSDTDTDWADVDTSFVTNSELMISTPQYYIERVGVVGGTDELGIGSSANCDNYAGCDHTPPTAMLYRVTARSGVPSDGRAIVAMQITVKQNL